MGTTWAVIQTARNAEYTRRLRKRLIANLEYTRPARETTPPVAGPARLASRAPVVAWQIPGAVAQEVTVVRSRVPLALRNGQASCPRYVSGTTVSISPTSPARGVPSAS